MLSIAARPLRLLACHAFLETAQEACHRQKGVTDGDLSSKREETVLSTIPPRVARSHHATLGSAWARALDNVFQSIYTMACCWLLMLKRPALASVSQ